MTGEVNTQRGADDPARGAYETADLDAKGAGLAIAGLGGTVWLVALAVAGLFLLFGGIREGTPPQPQVAAPAPPLQTDERLDRRAIEARTRARLEGRDGGLPIGEAMRRTVADGWDAGR
ncbi:MAG: hypothetical protein JF593_00880 [Novosphingobium sp.]|nr:hypothetical protein [Novosphingobium sp.]